jgi:signal transduction histidine kinase
VEKGEIIDAESLGALVNLARYAIEDSRRIMMDLRPTVLDDLGLIPTIVWYCKQKESVYRNITIIKEIGIEESQIDERLKTVIFRIIQEGLNNVLKHSRADVVNLSITMREGTVVLSIADNGVGFDVETALRQDSCEKGLGLLSMRERTELSGGTFSIASFMGKGTTVQATWALTMIGNCRFDTP